jgi:polysaccharide export outer membrane protein
VAAILALLVWIAPAGAEDYVLGAEAVLQVSVWLHPELERSLTVNADGNVMLPPVGEIKAAGLTAKQLSERIADRLSAYLRQTTTVTVSVTQYMSRSVYVSGAVAKPGRYGFEKIPSVMDVLSQAGGAIAGADLANVQVIRREGELRRTIAADVSATLRDGDTSRLPVLQPGDILTVPGAGGTASGDGVVVLGQVTRPGYYPAGQGLDVWTALALAGGTTDRGNLSDVRILTRGDGGVTVSKLDLKAVLDQGARAPVQVRSGDVVVVMSRGPNPWAAFMTVLGLSQNALNVAVLVDYFKGRNN